MQLRVFQNLGLNKDCGFRRIQTHREPVNCHLNGVLANLLGVSNSTVRRWESVPTAQVDAGSARVLAVLKDELAQKRGENERRAFKAAIMKALLIGGGLFALFVVLKAVFDKPKNSEEPDER